MNRSRIALEHPRTDAVHDGALLVHHIIVFERAFADREMLLLDAALGGFDGAVEPLVLHHLALFHAEPFHDTGDALGTEQTHELIFKRNEELRRARVALTRAAAAQLAVDTARFMALGADDMKTAEFFDAFAQLDVGAAPRHVGGDRHRPALTGERDDFSFARVVFGVEHFMRNARHFQHPGKDFRGVHRYRAQKDRLPFGVALGDIGDDRLELLALSAVDLVVLVDAVHRFVGGNRDDIQFIDVLEFARFGFRGSGHAGKLGVETEVILNRDRGERLGFLFDFNPFFRLDRLVQTVGPAPPGQHAAGEFIDDVDVVVLHDIIHVFFVKAVRTQQLIGNMDAIRPFNECALRNAPALKTLFVGERSVSVDGTHLGCEIGQNEKFRIGRTDLLAPLVGERNLAGALVDGEVHLVLELPGVLLEHFGKHLQLAVLVDAAHLGIFQQVHELLVLGGRVIDLVYAVARLFEIARGDGFFSLLDKVVALRGLNADDGRNHRVDFTVDVRGRHRRGTGNDQRRAGFIDQDGVDFVDNREIVPALHHLLRLLRHAVVAQVVETEFAVGAVGDVARVLFAALVGRHRVLNAADGETEEVVEMPHP